MVKIPGETDPRRPGLQAGSGEAQAAGSAEDGSVRLAEAAGRHEAGDAAGALAAYSAVLAAAPENVDALRLSGVALIQLRRLPEAEKVLRRAVALAPDYAAAWSNLAGLLSETERADEAAAAYRRALAAEPGNPQLQFNLANALANTGDQAGAAEAYRAALALQPAHPGALLGLGHVLKTLGDQAGAVAAYRACLAAGPAIGEAWWSLANLKTYRFDAGDIAAMRAALALPDLSEAARASLEYTLGKAFEDAGAYDTAFGWYAAGAARKRRTLAYDPVQTEAVNDRIIGTFSGQFLQERRGWGHADPAPIFILGLPRSGSTLIEQILASHSQVDGTSELPDLGRLAVSVGRFRSDGVTYPEAARDLEPGDCAALGRSYIARTRRHRGSGVFFTDKMPNNFPSIGLIRLILPNAKVIDARRHPLDSCMGSFKQLFAAGQAFSYDLFELGEYYRQYVRLMSHWDRAAPGFVLRVSYEDMVTDTEAQIRRLLEFCGLGFEPACLEFHKTGRAVRTASSEQVRRPIYTDALGSWRAFADHLGPLRSQLSDILDDLPESPSALR